MTTSASRRSARANFEPDVIAVYGNSAQVMRLVNAALFKRGGRIESTTGGRLDCAEIVIQTIVTGEPKVVLPCNGDRVFGMAQDTEMVFTMPWDRADEVLEGLEGTQKGGVRYPIPVAMRGTVTMPKHYQDLLAMLKKEEKPQPKSSCNPRPMGEVGSESARNLEWDLIQRVLARLWNF